MPQSIATGHCPNCGEPLECQPDGHHCRDCGFRDDVPCVRTFEPDEITFPDMPATIVLPRDVFDVILAVYQRRDAFRWAAYCATVNPDSTRRILELAAAHAAGSTRLTPEAAYWLGIGAACVAIDEAANFAAEDAYRTIRMLIPTDELRELDITDKAQQAAAKAEYIAWKAAQPEADQ